MGDTCYVVQDTQQSNIYHVFHPLHFLVAIVQMPTDSQYMLDSKLLSALVDVYKRQLCKRHTGCGA